MSREVKVLTQELSGNLNISLNGTQFTFTEDMLSALAALASSATITEDGYIQFNTVELSAK